MAEESERDNLPVMPGFREMALRRRRLAAELVELRRRSGLSQTQVAARMGTSQSAVARLEAGEVDARLSTFERYAAAVGHQVDVRLRTHDSGASTKNLTSTKNATSTRNPTSTKKAAGTGGGDTTNSRTRRRR
ncbi:helix-turn-helix domain-containing protein [Actinopolymorpha alba]|uniref:helix-turn-helix domain-containing protein n=1 Tax=Actinopolymorpha alba TaxID=533267 RepID=UPI000364D660|nr:helix-turn-helix transcriptional regulator [Actinopolymorpha alba]